jgi:hypothetical protein
MAWARGEDSVDAKAGAYTTALFMHLIESALTGKKK